VGRRKQLLPLLSWCCRYYLNNQDAYRLKLLLPLTEAQQAKLLQQEADGQLLQSMSQPQHIQ
jgi:hypothetical protein